MNQPQGHVSIEFQFAQQGYPVFALHGREAINASYAFTFRVHAPELLSPDDVLGQPAQLVFCAQPDESVCSWPSVRIIPGYLFNHRVLSPYTLEQVEVEFELRPRLSLLALHGEPRVYTHKNALEVVRRLLLRHGYLDSSLRILLDESSSEIHTHWVQGAQERDLDFFCRVLAREGISFCWGASEEGREVLYLMDEPMHYPENPGRVLFRMEHDGLMHDVLNAVYQLKTTQHVPSWRVTYRDYNPSSPQEVMTVHYGKGSRPVMIWGAGANSIRHLERLARRHYEYLTMNELEYEALSHNPHVLPGHRLRVVSNEFSARTSGGLHWVVQSVTHTLQDGHYHNTLQAVPTKKFVRPPPAQRTAGHTVHTAQIDANDELPWLDTTGQYSYYTHVHYEEGNLAYQQAPRLSPYGGKSAVGLAMGMHFPLKRHAEVLVMYLHNDYNQPVLHNSPSNEINRAMFTRDNSWNSGLKTAWGQFLLFSDRKNQTEMTLSNAQGRNRLQLRDFGDEEGIELQCERGSIDWCTQTSQSLHSGQSMTLQAGHTVEIAVEHDALYQGKSIHQQAETHTLESQTDFKINARRHLEVSAQSVQLSSDGNIQVRATGEPIQFYLPNGDLVWEADHLEFTSPVEINLQAGASRIHLHTAGITLSAPQIHFNAPQITTTMPPQPQPGVPVLPALLTPKLHALQPVPCHQFSCLKKIEPPQWNKSFYHAGELAQVHVTIHGFSGQEAGRVSIVRASDNQPRRSHPLLRQIEGETVGEQEFTLGNPALYPNAVQATHTPGTAQLVISISLQPLSNTTSPHAPYYAKIEIGDVIGQRYSDPMLLLGKVELSILQDKAFAYSDSEAIVSVSRALPECLRDQRQCPSPQDKRYYSTPTVLEHLPAGKENWVMLRERGEYRELLTRDATHPQSGQFIEVKPTLHEVELIRLMPPMIMDLRSARCEGGVVRFEQDSVDARIALREEEVQYIQANGNNLMVFIHGFNVPPGEFAKHWVEVDGRLEVGGAQATIYRDEAFLQRQFPNKKPKLLKQYVKSKYAQVSGAHEWIVQLEHHLNRAAGFDGEHYDKFTRCLFILWPGDPRSPLDYMSAVTQSIRMGEVLAQVIRKLHAQISGLELNVIAHSQGNSVLLHALNVLGGQQQPALVNHAFMWQAAIPHDALSPERPAARSPHDLWYCPHARSGAKQFTVLYSKHDNILGPLFPKNDQLEEYSLQEVWMRKDPMELASALVIQSLGFQSLYQTASCLGVPVTDLFREEALNSAWYVWRKMHPTFKLPNRPECFECQPTLSAQEDWLMAQGLGADFQRNFSKQLSEGLEECRGLLERCFKQSPDEESDAQKFQPPVLLSLLNLMIRVAYQYRQVRRVIDQTPLVIISSLVDEGLSLVCKAVFRKQLTLIKMTLLTERKDRPAMGYGGADNVSNDLGNINSEDTSAWVWYHSDMKLPSQDIIDEVYGTLITQNISFGCYK